jgi:hypothetical protein
VISEEVARLSGVNVGELPRHEVTVRNRGEALKVFAVDDVSKIAERLRLVGSERR